MTFLRNAMKDSGEPNTFASGGLKTCDSALQVLSLEDRQETGLRWLDNRVENSHQPLRRRERAMFRFRQMRSLQKFASVHSSVFNHFNKHRHPNRWNVFKANRAAAPAEWCQLGAA